LSVVDESNPVTAPEAVHTRHLILKRFGHLFPSVRERIRTALEDTWQEAEQIAG
jgi:hypothetical protein